MNDRYAEMNQRKSCHYENQLANVLSGSVPADQLTGLQEHMEDCSTCQANLESLAADDLFWKKASSILSDTKSISDLSKSRSLKHSSISLMIDEEIAEPDSVNETFELLDPAAHPEMLGRIGNFDVSEIIGRGGMGVVYKGFDTELNRPVAIKVLAPHLAASGIARKRFAREAQAAAAVQHPNIVPIHSVNATAADSVSPNRPYLVMTLVSGKSLQTHVEERGPLPVKDVVRIAQQIAAGLAAAHKKGLVHRDIKPANILMENDVNRVMITDFGLARAANDVGVTQTGWLVGTPHYMSPEQVKGSEIDSRSDLFSMGGVLYFLCTGREPFRGDRPFAVIQKIVNEHPIDAQAVNNEVTKTLAQIIRGLVDKNVDQRFQSAAEVDDVLTQYLAHLQNPRLEPKPKIKLAKTRLMPRRLIGLAALMVGVAFFGWWQLGTWHDKSKIEKKPKVVSHDHEPDQRVQPGSAQQTLTPSTPEPAESGSNLEWMQGLMSFEKWQLEAEQLDREIRSLENEFNNQNGN